MMLPGMPPEEPPQREDESALFDKLDPDTGMAFVVLSHMATHQPSMLVEILARHTKMPVSTIAAGLSPEPNRVHALSPGHRVFLHRGIFQLEPRGHEDRGSCR